MGENLTEHKMSVRNIGLSVVIMHSPCALQTHIRKIHSGFVWFSCRSPWSCLLLCTWQLWFSWYKSFSDEWWLDGFPYPEVHVPGACLGGGNNRESLWPSCPPDEDDASAWPLWYRMLEGRWPLVQSNRAHLMFIHNNGYTCKDASSTAVNGETYVIRWHK